MTVVMWNHDGKYWKRCGNRDCNKAILASWDQHACGWVETPEEKIAVQERQKELEGQTSVKPSPAKQVETQDRTPVETQDRTQEIILEQTLNYCAHHISLFDNKGLPKEKSIEKLNAVYNIFREFTQKKWGGE